MDKQGYVYFVSSYLQDPNKSASLALLQKKNPRTIGMNQQGFQKHIFKKPICKNRDKKKKKKKNSKTGAPRSNIPIDNTRPDTGLASCQAEERGPSRALKGGDDARQEKGPRQAYRVTRMA